MSKTVGDKIIPNNLLLSGKVHIIQSILSFKSLQKSTLCIVYIFDRFMHT